MRIVVSMILFYGIISTFFYDVEIIGRVGVEFGKANIALFGYLAYINLFLLAHLVYKILNGNLKSINFDTYIGWTLLFLSMLIAQPLIVDFKNSGVISLELYRTIISIGGKVGYFFVWIFTFFLSLAILVESDPLARELWIELKGGQKSRKKERAKDILLSILLTFRDILSNPFASNTALDRDIIRPKRRDGVSKKAKSRLEREREKLKELQKRIKRGQEKVNL